MASPETDDNQRVSLALGTLRKSTEAFFVATAEWILSDDDEPMSHRMNVLPSIHALAFAKTVEAVFLNQTMTDKAKSGLVAELQTSIEGARVYYLIGLMPEVEFGISPETQEEVEVQLLDWMEKGFDVPGICASVTKKFEHSLHIDLGMVANALGD
jgi:hypothetical protein